MEINTHDTIENEITTTTTIYNQITGIDLDFLTFEDRTDWLSQNVGTELQLYAA
jgi:hypothetical protein